MSEGFDKEFIEERYAKHKGNFYKGTVTIEIESLIQSHLTPI
jgi:hypothetical protein